MLHYRSLDKSYCRYITHKTGCNIIKNEKHEFGTVANTLREHPAQMSNLLTLNIFHTFFSVCIVYFEKVNLLFTDHQPLAKLSSSGNPIPRVQ